MHDVQENFKKIMYNRFDANKVSCVSRETPQYLNQIEKIKQNAEMKNRPDADSDYAFSDSSGNNSDNDELNQIKKFQNRMVVPLSQQIDEFEEDSSDVTSDQSSRIITHGSNLNDQSHFVDIQKAVEEDKLKTNETIKKSQAKNKGAAKLDKNKKKYADINDATQNESQFMGLITDTNLPFDVLNSKETEQEAKKNQDDRYQVDIFENEAPEDGL